MGHVISIDILKRELVALTTQHECTTSEGVVRGQHICVHLTCPRHRLVAVCIQIRNIPTI